MNQQAYKKREDLLNAVKAMREEQKSLSPAESKVEQMPLEIKQLLDFDESQLQTIHYLMDLNNNRFLKSNDTYQFMKNHNMKTEKKDKLMENLIFSKQFFNIMDEDGSGTIDLKELSYPLVALGLANNSEFVKKAMQMLNPKKFGTCDFTQEINLKEFSRIFHFDQT